VDTSPSAIEEPSTKAIAAAGEVISSNKMSSPEFVSGSMNLSAGLEGLCRSALTAFSWGPPHADNEGCLSRGCDGEVYTLC
jgi:hypothetical protein